MNGIKSTLIEHPKFIKDLRELEHYKESLRIKHKADEVYINYRNV